MTPDSAAAEQNVLPPLAPERLDDARPVAALIERVFGPGRYAKTAERLRETNRPLLDLSHVAWSGGALVGCVRMWPIRIGETRAVLLGPFAVDPAWRSRGLGAALIAKACEATHTAGHGLILLVGDAPYFGPLGFSIAPPGRVLMPGPVDPSRVMLRVFDRSAAEASGAVVPGWGDPRP